MATKTKVTPTTNKLLTPPAQKALKTRKQSHQLDEDTFAQSSLTPQPHLGKLTTKSGMQANVYSLNFDREHVVIIPLNVAGAQMALCFTVEVSELRPEDRIKLGLTKS